jgi:hypothetical protein
MHPLTAMQNLTFAADARRIGRALPVRMVVVEANGSLRGALLELFAESCLPAIVVTDGAAVVRHLESWLAHPRPGLEVAVADIDGPGWEILDVGRARGWPVRVVLTAEVPTPALRWVATRSGAAELLPRPHTKEEWRAVLTSAVTVPSPPCPAGAPGFAW